jgi:chemotaxis protein CheD
VRLLSAELRVPPPVIPGFQYIRRYWDAQTNRWIAQILAGEFYVTAHDEVIATVLGSCIAVCIRDVRLRIGGMNHFMLPQLPEGAKEADALRYGSAAIERLVNELLKQGARRNSLEIKVFGGGHVIAGMADIGQRNVEFVSEYFRREGMLVAAEDVGQDFARRVRFEPATGRARVRQLPMNHDEKSRLEREEAAHFQMLKNARGNNVELF